jgi:hypothetical protein
LSQGTRVSAAGTTGKYLLTGLARCGCCGGSMLVKSRSHGRKRAFRYGCSSYHLRGAAICANKMEGLLEEADELALDMIERDVLDPYVIEGAVSRALKLLDTMRDGGSRRADLAFELETLEAELQRLTAAIAAGANLNALLAAMRERESRCIRLRREIARLDETTRAVQTDRKEIEAQLRARLDDWRGLLRQETLWSRQIITKLLDGKITFTPTTDKSGNPAYEMQAKLALGRFFSGILCPKGGTSPAGFEPALPA